MLRLVALARPDFVKLDFALREREKRNFVSKDIVQQDSAPLCTSELRDSHGVGAGLV